MADNYGPTFAGGTAIGEIIVQASQTAVINRINLVKALIPDITANTQAAHPDFDQIPPHTAAKLRAELDALSALIEAAPHA